MLRVIVKMTYILKSGLRWAGLCGFRQNPLKIISTSFWPFGRHTPRRCPYFRAIFIIKYVTKLLQVRSGLFVTQISLEGSKENHHILKTEVRGARLRKSYRSRKH